MAFDTFFFLSGRDDLQLLNTDVSKRVLHHQPTQLFQHHAKGAVIIYGRGGGRRENGWVKEKFEVL